MRINIGKSIPDLQYDNIDPTKGGAQGNFARTRTQQTGRHIAVAPTRYRTRDIILSGIVLLYVVPKINTVV